MEWGKDYMTGGDPTKENFQIPICIEKRDGFLAMGVQGLSLEENGILEVILFFRHESPGV